MTIWLIILSKETAQCQLIKHPTDWQILEGFKLDADNYIKSYSQNIEILRIDRKSASFSRFQKSNTFQWNVLRASH